MADSSGVITFLVAIFLALLGLLFERIRRRGIACNQGVCFPGARGERADARGGRDALGPTTHAADIEATLAAGLLSQPDGFDALSAWWPEPRAIMERKSLTTAVAAQVAKRLPRALSATPEPDMTDKRRLRTRPCPTHDGSRPPRGNTPPG